MDLEVLKINLNNNKLEKNMTLKNYDRLKEVSILY
jgi:hypothetical protein